MAGMKMPTPVSGGLILSYQCTAACRHCMYGCSPKWPGDWISEPDLEAVLNRLAGKIQPSPWGKDNVSLNHGLHFTGGEPFLNFDLLLKAVEMAEGLGIPSTFVETNCFWCHSDQVTREKLKKLKDTGLKGILVSVNPFYAEYVPLERSERCIRISREVFGKNVMVYQLEYLQRFKRLGIRGRIALEDYLERTKEENLAENVELFLMGRAARRLRDFYSPYPAQDFFQTACVPSFLRNWHNHFDNFGNILPGYCGGISLGSWKEMDTLIGEGIDLETHPLLGFFIHKDMEGLFQYAQDFGYQESPQGYVSKCDLCLDIRSFLASRENFEELRPKAFYEHVSMTAISFEVDHFPVSIRKS